MFHVKINDIKDQININVESIINRLTSEKDLPVRSDPEDEIQSSEVDEPDEELQMAFNLEAESQFNIILRDFLRN